MAASMETLYLKASDLTAHRADSSLFKALNFTLLPSQVLQILGPNGIGKSTLLKILAGLRSPEAGSVMWSSKAIQDNLVDYQKELAYLGHRLALKLSLTVAENLKMSVSSSLSSDSLLCDLGLLHHKNSLVSNLSQGQKQRLALARVFLSQKKLWILDEPFSALDQQGFELLQYLLQQHLTKSGMVVLSSHRPLEFRSNVHSIYLERDDA